MTRRVGVCAHCQGAVLLRIRPGRFARVRDARCKCGATVIPATWFTQMAALAKSVLPS